MQHLYEGYKNLIQRILEPRTGAARHGNNTPRSLSNLTGVRGVVVADSALTRFERLTDRITLLILSETQEFLEEKEALINTVVPLEYMFDSLLISSSSISISTPRRTPSQQPALHGLLHYLQS